jgi:hypothetical protein
MNTFTVTNAGRTVDISKMRGVKDALLTMTTSRSWLHPRDRRRKIVYESSPCPEGFLGDKTIIDEITLMDDGSRRVKTMRSSAGQIPEAMHGTGLSPEQVEKSNRG